MKAEHPKSTWAYKATNAKHEYKTYTAKSHKTRN